MIIHHLLNQALPLLTMLDSRLTLLQVFISQFQPTFHPQLYAIHPLQLKVVPLQASTLLRFEPVFLTLFCVALPPVIHAILVHMLLL